MALYQCQFPNFDCVLQIYKMSSLGKGYMSTFYTTFPTSYESNYFKIKNYEKQIVYTYICVYTYIYACIYIIYLF